ncbi:biotin--[acetyl-CoA-carboxylase] ligase [Tepiditoga spiralis]|uniref:Biotin--[acetyl-CoA-carboxylase] ligase n=1 Tax=Tepiditoga spiralis TaxID=2108365 RepID=A0A7G1G8M6_9BACT|nr:biotin--[acetyl-CoA-carboxylase] ligase [Tepiditoga spiralis]BBE31273.1 biotin--[acetyl-CoA-carboxylase] ligase [Tepiditoga spiralis]
MIGDRTVFFQKINSTNTYLKENYQKFPSESVVWAEEQTSSYGRRGNSWTSSKGGLWFSTIFKPKKRPMNPWHYVRLYSLTIYDIITKYNVNCKIKWPNDILIDNKKVCGILSEAIYKGKNIEAIIVGVGLNVNNKIDGDLKNIGISLSEITSREFNLKKLLSEINHKAYYTYYLKYLKDKSVSVITKKWISALNIKINDEVKIKKVDGNIIYGKIKRINPDYIEITDENFEDKIMYAGEISVR